MNRACKVLGVAVLLTLMAWGTALAVPNLIQYQGRLTDNAGTPLNGSFNIRFAIYSDSLGVTELWNETRSVTIANGLFSLALGSGTAFPATVFTGTDRFLGLRVAPDAADMTPRQRLSTVPFAQRSQTTELTAGVAFRRFINVGVAASTTVPVDSVTITIPGDGFIEVHASGNVYTFHGSGSSTMVFKVDEQRFNTNFGGAGSGDSYFEWPLNSLFPATLHEITVSCRRFYAKAAGTYKFYFNVRTGVDGGGIQGCVLSATYYPTALGTSAKQQEEPSLMIVGESIRPVSERARQDQ